VFFSQEAIEEMAGSYGSMDERSEALVLAFASFDFKNDRAREFATHGFSRRIRTTHCIENVFNNDGNFRLFAQIEPEAQGSVRGEVTNENVRQRAVVLFLVGGICTLPALILHCLIICCLRIACH
jgi:hypothetical protein